MLDAENKPEFDAIYNQIRAGWNFLLRLEEASKQCAQDTERVDQNSNLQLETEIELPVQKPKK